MDTLSATQRSSNMKRIRSSNTRPELAVRSLLHVLGYRFRIHRNTLPGKPDIVFPSRKKVIFVHGCFWHQHKRCIDGRLPKSRTSYWIPKLERNQKRDKNNRRKLNALGWGSLTVWDCQTADRDKLQATLCKFLRNKAAAGDTQTSCAD